VLAHRETDAFMHKHCDACVADVKATADTDALAATRVVWPNPADRRQPDDQRGRPHDSNSAFRLDRATRIRGRAGQRVPRAFHRRHRKFRVVPQTQLGRPSQWIDALASCKRWRPRSWCRVTVRRAPPAGLSKCASTCGRCRTKRARANLRGDGLLEDGRASGACAFRSWALYEAHHRRNVHFAYLQIEEQDLFTNTRFEKRPRLP